MSVEAKLETWLKISVVLTLLVTKSVNCKAIGQSDFKITLAQLRMITDIEKATKKRRRFEEEAVMSLTFKSILLVLCTY